MIPRQEQAPTQSDLGENLVNMGQIEFLFKAISLFI